MDRALALADWNGIRPAPARVAAARQAARHRARQLRRNRPPARRANAPEVTVRPERRVDVAIGTLSSGQGHETSFAQCVAEWLGVAVRRDHADPGRHRHRPGRRRLAFRAARCGMAGVVMGKASEHDASRRPGGSPPMLLEAAAPTSPFAERTLHGEGHRPRDRPVRDRARRGRGAMACPRICAGPLPPACDETVRVAAFRSAAHVCEVEVDPDTGPSRSCATPPSTTSAAPSIR